MKQDIVFVIVLGLLTGCSSRPDERESAGAFDGSWMAEGEVCYEISHNAGETPIIRVPANDTWRVEIEDVKLDNLTLRFYQYHYTPARDEMKSVTNPSGEHPFSGVRCEVTLTMKPGEPNRMTMSLKTAQTTEPIIGVLTKQE